MSCNSMVVFIYTSTNFDLNEQFESPDMLWLPVQWDSLVVTQVPGETPPSKANPRMRLNH